MDLAHIQDLLYRLAESGGARVTLFVASVLAIPVTAVAMARWGMGVVRTFRRRRSLRTLAAFIRNEPALGIVTTPGPQTTPAHRAEATAEIAAAVKAMDYLGVTAGYRLRQAAQLPITGRVTLADTEASVIRSGDIGPPWHRVYWRVYAVKGMAEQLLSEMTE